MQPCWNNKTILWKNWLVNINYTGFDVGRDHCQNKDNHCIIVRNIYLNFGKTSHQVPSVQSLRFLSSHLRIRLPNLLPNCKEISQKLNCLYCDSFSISHLCYGYGYGMLKVSQEVYNRETRLVSGHLAHKNFCVFIVRIYISSIEIPRKCECEHHSGLHTNQAKLRKYFPFSKFYCYKYFDAPQVYTITWLDGLCAQL